MKGEYVSFSTIDERRKRVRGIMAAILAARKLAQYDGGKRVPATVAAIAMQYVGQRRLWGRLMRVIRGPIKVTTGFLLFHFRGHIRVLK